MLEEVALGGLLQQASRGRSRVLRRVLVFIPGEHQAKWEDCLPPCAAVSGDKEGIPPNQGSWKNPGKKIRFWTLAHMQSGLVAR